jgi:hypothetical protein
VKEQLESVLRYLDDGGSITQACIEYGQKTNSTAAIIGLLRVRELINIALQLSDVADGEDQGVCGDGHTCLINGHIVTINE